MLSFADALFAYVDELEALSREGYLEVRTQDARQAETLRRRLLHLVLAGPPVPRTALTELSEQTGWPLPEQVTLVALRSPAELSRPGTDSDVLVDLADPQPHLLVPGELDEARRRMLRTALPTTPAAVGLTVPLASAADSVRWARRVLDLIDAGVIADTHLAFCADHLVTLWLFADPALVDRLAARELAPLAGLTPTRRERLIDTLRTWLDTRGTAAQMGESLGVHPQTVRYRMRNLESRFGGRLADPGTRFAIEVALRALHLRAEPGRRDGG